MLNKIYDVFQKMYCGIRGIEYFRSFFMSFIFIYIYMSCFIACMLCSVCVALLKAMLTLVHWCCVTITT